VLFYRWVRGRTAFNYVMVFLFLLSSVLFLGPVTSAGQPQSDTTAEAKQHYQNAVAAIGKGDWQSAKSELLRAEKLAPQNALVHYDLALAYSHTGQAKSAQTEVNKALQLGLPAEQTKAAEGLRQRLASQEATPSGSATKQKSSASAAEILDWLKDKVNSEATLEDSRTMGSTTTTFSNASTIAEVAGCSFTLVFQVSELNSNSADPIFSQSTRIDLAKSRSDVVVKKETSGAWAVIIFATSSFSTVTKGKPESSLNASRAIGFPEPDEDIARRVAKALSDAIEKCGGKKVKELY
jgi:hypothetical protein